MDRITKRLVLNMLCTAGCVSGAAYAAWEHNLAAAIFCAGTIVVVANAGSLAVLAFARIEAIDERVAQYRRLTGLSEAEAPIDRESLQ